VEQGIPGILLFLFLLGCIEFRTILALEDEGPLAQRLWVLMIYVGIAGSIVYGLFDTIWYRPSVNLVFWLYVAMLASLTEPLLPRLATPSDKSSRALDA